MSAIEDTQRLPYVNDWLHRMHDVIRAMPSEVAVLVANGSVRVVATDPSGDVYMTQDGRVDPESVLPNSRLDRNGQWAYEAGRCDCLLESPIDDTCAIRQALGDLLAAASGASGLWERPPAERRAIIGEVLERGYLALGIAIDGEDDV